MLWLLLQCCQIPTLGPYSTHLGGHLCMVVGQQFSSSFLDHGRPARVSGWPTRWGGRPATSQKFTWPASFLLSSPFQLSGYFSKYPWASGGYFGRERLPPFPSPFTPFLAYLKGWTAPLPRLEILISRPSLPKPPFSYSKTLKTFKLPSSTLHQP